MNTTNSFPLAKFFQCILISKADAEYQMSKSQTAYCYHWANVFLLLSKSNVKLAPCSFFKLCLYCNYNAIILSQKNSYRLILYLVNH